jgi:quercetin dioxygenase-like cupin family protein
MVEARRLRNSIASWRAIPPRPAARQEVFDTAMQLLSKAGETSSLAPQPPPPGLPVTAERKARFSTFPPAPPSGVKREILTPGVTLLRPKAMTWRPLAVLEGIAVKVLYRQPSTGELHALVRLAPGAEIPEHRHPIVEDILMLDGILLLGDVTLRSGEFCHADPGTVHAHGHSPQGCTFFLIGSEKTDFLPKR